MDEEKTSVIACTSFTISIDEVYSRIEKKIFEFRSILQKNGISQAELSRRLGVSRSAISRVIYGNSRSKYIEKALLRHGVNLEELHLLLSFKEIFNGKQF